MKVSIITVCYNSAATIRDTIESVLGQTYSDIEYIIVDGASTDATLPIISEYSNYLAKVISEPDKGLYDAMNKGIEVTTGEVVGILNSDDFYESNDSISAVVDCFVANPGSDLVFGDLVFIKPDQLDVIIRHYTSAHFKAWKLRFGWMPPHPATFIRKSVYLSIGKYSLDYKISADYEMFVRLLMVNNFRYTHLNKILVKMRAGGLSSSGIGSNILLNYEIVKACRSNGIYTNIVFVLSKIPFKLLELIRNPKEAP